MELTANFGPLWHFVNERHAIYLRKKFAEEGSLSARETVALVDYDYSHPEVCRVSAAECESRVYTKDPILAAYRFCNVFRELDRVTVWIRKNIREPFADHPHLWLMLAIARTINWPETLTFLVKHSWPDMETFSPSLLGTTLDAWKDAGNKTYTGSYMIRAESDRAKPWYDWTKQQYIARIVLGRLWEDRDRLQGVIDQPDGQTLQGVWEHVLKSDRYIGWGPFMIFQWVLELRHTRYLRDAPDASTWAAVGPGSMRGLNRLHGRPVKQRLTQGQALAEMTELLGLSRTGVLGPHVPPLEMEDVQNSLCETDKMLRVKNGEGTPRSRYVPGRGW